MPTQTVGDNATGPAISFVVPVRNDVDGVARCLRSIASVAPPFPVEVVVVDNGSTDGTAAAARALGAGVIVHPEVSVATLRNRGAAEALASVIAFVDADHELASGWVAAALDVFKDPSIGAVGAQYSAPPSGTWVQRHYGYLRGRTMGRSDVAWLGSGNLAVRRLIFENVGGFDASLQTCEDVDLCTRLRREGWRIVGDARLGSVHRGDPQTLRQLFVAERWRGRDNLRVSLRARPRAADVPSVLIPVIDLIAVLTLCVGVVVAVMGRPPGLSVLIACAVVVLLLSGLRALRVALRWPLKKPADWLGAWVVATVYDVARAASLVWPAGHRRARRGQPISEPTT